jgi:hypothetical protein
MRDTNLITSSGVAVLVRGSFIIEQQYLAKEILFLFSSRILPQFFSADSLNALADIIICADFLEFSCPTKSLANKAALLNRVLYASVARV